MSIFWLPEPARARDVLEDLGLIDPTPTIQSSGGGVIVKEEIKKPKIAVLNIEFKKNKKYDLENIIKINNIKFD